MIVFLLSNIPDPRMNKRIAIAKKLDSVMVICAERDHTNLWKPYHTDVPHHIFRCTMPSWTHIWKRIQVSLAFRRFARNLLKEANPGCIYAGGLDCYTIAWLYSRFRKIKLIYEIADVREFFLTNRKTIYTVLFPLFEKLLLKSVSLVVLTSEKFFDAYYYRQVPAEKVVVIPNTPNLEFFKNYHKRQHSHFTVGFIGGIRYLNQLKLLVDAAQTSSVNVFFAGGNGSSDMETELHEYCAGKKGIEFSGTYDYATEISGLYEKVDCVYSVYDADNCNVRIALPNKLYEAVFCELPLLVARNTYLAEIVNRYGIGVAVAHNHPEELAETLKKLSTDKAYYDSFVQNCRKHKEEILASDSPRKLEERIRAILSEKI